MSDAQLALAEAMNEPEGLLRVDVRLLKELPEGRYFAVKLAAKCETHPKGSYALIRLAAECGDHDLVAVGQDRYSMQIMRLIKTETGWTFQPVKGSRLRPWFVCDLSFVLGKVEQIFDCED